MKSADVWALILLGMMPEKPLELEGIWRSCEDVGGGDLLYVAEFKKNELVEDYYGLEGNDGKCDGERLFHQRRSWDLRYNNFNFRTQYKESRFYYFSKKGAPAWSGRKLSDIFPKVLSLGQNLKYEYTYRIRGETLEINLREKKRYLTRIEYPLWFKSKEFFFGFFFKKRPNEGI